MHLLAHLLSRIAAVVLLCLSATTAFVLLDAHRAIDTATVGSADRVGRQLQGLYWHELLWREGYSKSSLLPQPDWETLATAKVIAPGICVRFETREAPGRPLCGAADSIGAPAPAWFAGVYRRLFGPFPVVRRPLDIRQRTAGTIEAVADIDGVLRLTWLRISVLLEVASLMALAIAVLVSLLVARALVPVGRIIAGLRHLEAGAYSHRIGGGRFEFGHIAHAVDALADRLTEAQAARTALTRRLFQVQEEERRALARDLHDEFGQCLAATGALAGSIAAGATDRPDLLADAAAITTATRRMMTTLKDALVRLRSQEVDEQGLESCLEALVATWNGRGGGARVRLDTRGDLARVPQPIAINLFRVAQECLTNAAKHGDATLIRLAIETSDTAAVALSVEDDGGGDPAALDAGGAGHGVLGMRERVAALGGSLTIARAARGIRVAATIPLALPVAFGAPMFGVS